MPARIYKISYIVLMVVVLFKTSTVLASETTLEITEQRSETDFVAISGMDISYWSYQGETFFGPGLMWGLELIPSYLELNFTLGIMTGKKVTQYPIEMDFNIRLPKWVWVKPYLSFGPALILEHKKESEYDWAFTGGGGLELTPPGFSWGIYLEGDYNLRFLGEVTHEGGFSSGFRYRFGSKEAKRKIRRKQQAS